MVNLQITLNASQLAAGLTILATLTFVGAVIRWMFRRNF